MTSQLVAASVIMNHSVLRGVQAWSDPGDGTRYEILAFRFEEPLSCGWLGSVDAGGWLIVSSLPTRRAYLFQPTGVLHENYVGEKLGLGLDSREARHVARLISMVTGRPGLEKVG